MTLPATHPADEKKPDANPTGPAGKPEEKKPDEKPIAPGPDTRPETGLVGKPEDKDSKPVVNADAEAVQKHFQTLYQEEMAWLKENHPEVREEYEESRKGAKTDDEDRPLTRRELREEMERLKEAGQQDGFADDDEDRPLTRAELRQEMKRLREEERAERQKERATETEQSRIQAYRKEYVEVEKRVEALSSPRMYNGEPLLDANGEPIPRVDPGILEKAVAIVGSYHIGKPSAAYRALLNTIKQLEYEEGMSSTRVSIAAQEADRLRATMLAIQPGGASAGGIQDKTPLQKEIEEKKKQAAKNAQSFVDAMPEKL